jgi:predicted ATPase
MLPEHTKESDHNLEYKSNDLQDLEHQSSNDLGNGFIQSITIKNYKTIKNLENFPLRNINILIGANGAGKSNFLKLWQLLKMSLGTPDTFAAYVAKQGEADALLSFGRKCSDRMEIELSTLYTAFGHSFFCVLGSTDYNTLLPPKYFFRPYPLGFKIEEYKGVSGVSMDTIWNHYSKILNQLQQYHFHDTTATSPILSSQPLYQNDRLFSDGENIAPFIYRIYKHYRQNYDLLVRTIRALVPDFYDFHIDIQLKDTDNTSLFWLNRNDMGSDNVKKYHPVLLSDGSLRIICLLTVLLQPKELMPKIILIDEPELGLHPQAIDLISQIIKDASEHAQFIIATQSPAFINLFAPEDIVVVDKNADGTSDFNRLDSSKLNHWLQNYSLSELWYKNILGGQP